MFSRERGGAIGICPPRKARITRPCEIVELLGVVAMFAATLALELKDMKVGTTVIAPGPVDTPMWDSLETAEELAPMLKRLRLLQLIPNKSPESIAKLAVDAVANGKSYVGLPRRLGGNHLMRNLPSKITGAILAGVPLGPQPGKG